mgnify:CR=1 FL=1
MRPKALISFPIALVFANLLAVSAVLAQSPALVTSPTYIELPPPRQETITVAPSAQDVWVPGSWDRTPDEWAWTNGRWVTPPFRRAYWAPGYWQHVGGRYQWQTGHWAAGAQGAVVTQKVEIPAPLVQTQPAPPAGLGAPAWVPGHWEWRGTWVWAEGHYVASSVAQAVWVQGDWESAADGTWRWNPAHWAVR